MAGKAGHRGFGNIRKLPNGRYQASYVDPEGATYVSRHGNPRPVRYNAPHTFQTKLDAEGWLTAERRLISEGRWTPPHERAAARRDLVTFGKYAAAWLDGRRVKRKPLAARTRAHYEDLLERFILPRFADTPLRAITPEMVDDWHAVTATGTPTYQAHAYSLLRTILGTAADRRLIPNNPARIVGAGSTNRARDVKPASIAELETIVSEMPERLRLMVLLATWCALRFGELAELRRSDVDTKASVVRVRRGVVRVPGGKVVGPPKTDAGIRPVAYPPELAPLVREHLLQHCEPGRDGLLFPAKSGGQMAPSSLYRHFYRAREAAGRPDLRWHDLRHTGATFAARTGATLAELMSRLGHSTPAAALRYQHAASERDAEIAAKLGAMMRGEQ